MAPWIRFLEAYMVQLLLRTPAFHRAVEKVARGVHRARHGIPPEEMGGTKIDGPNNGSFLKHFTEEVQTQLGRAEARSGETAVKSSSENAVASKGAPVAKAEEETAETAWESAKRRAEEGGGGERQGFLGEYVGALREQLRGGK